MLSGIAMYFSNVKFRPGKSLSYGLTQDIWESQIHPKLC